MTFGKIRFFVCNFNIFFSNKNFLMQQNLLAGILIEFFKVLWNFIPKFLNARKFRLFFGKNAIDSEKVYLVLDPYEHPESRDIKLQHRYIKKFHGRKEDSPIVGEDKVLGSCSIRNIKYGASEFGLYREKVNPVQSVTDEEVKDIWEGTFICFGSSDSNLKTFDIEKLPANNLYEFVYSKTSKQRIFRVMGQDYSINNDGDVGIIFRIKNPYFSEHKLFICAGLGEWGTSGAAYYLFKNWKELYKEYKEYENFICLVRVKVNSDESSKLINKFKI
jgi:hypothetical protein